MSNLVEPPDITRQYLRMWVRRKRSYALTLVMQMGYDATVARRLADRMVRSSLASLRRAA
jgi:hypothetical protein